MIPLWPIGFDLARTRGSLCGGRIRVPTTVENARAVLRVGGPCASLLTSLAMLRTRVDSIAYHRVVRNRAGHRVRNDCP